MRSKRARLLDNVTVFIGCGSSKSCKRQGLLHESHLSLYDKGHDKSPCKFQALRQMRRQDYGLF